MYRKLKLRCGQEQEIFWSAATSIAYIQQIVHKIADYIFHERRDSFVVQHSVTKWRRVTSPRKEET